MEKINNEKFKGVEFDTFDNEVGNSKIFIIIILDILISKGKS